jgi:hypothetical protein
MMSWRVASTALVATVALVAAMAQTSPARRPVSRTPRLGSGAVYQAPLGPHSCYGSAPLRLGAQRCTTISQLAGADSTVRPVVAPDSRAVYVADQGGVLVLRGDGRGGLSYDSCLRVSDACGAQADGSIVSQLVLGPGGHELYVVLSRQRDGGAELLGLPIGAGDRLGAAPACLLLSVARQFDVVPNPRGCVLDTGDDRADASGLALTPDGRFGYVISGSGSVVSVVALVRGANGALTPGPGCVSADGNRPDQPGACNPILRTPATAFGTLNVTQLVSTPDSASLIVRGEEAGSEHLGGFIARFGIAGDGHLVPGAGADACVNASGDDGCTRSTALIGDLTRVAIARGRVYVGTSHITNPTLGIVASAVLGYRLSADGGLTLPTGPAGCVGNVTAPFSAPRKRLGSCSLGREAMREPKDVVAGPRGDVLHVVGFVRQNLFGIGLLRLGGDGAPAPVTGPTGCALGGPVSATERVSCNHSFAVGALEGIDTTLALAPDGAGAYVIDQPLDAFRVVVLRRHP